MCVRAWRRRIGVTAATLRETDALPRPGAVPHHLQEAPRCIKMQHGQELHLWAEGKIAAGCVKT